jgi:hypothetical protein
MNSSPRVVKFSCAVAALVAGTRASPALAGGPVLPDWTKAHFGAASARSTHPYFPLVPGTFSEYEGEVEGGAVERVETFVTFDTKTILGVANRVVRDTTLMDGVVVEIAEDWYAQSDDGTVWYFGESVQNFHYDESGELSGIDTAGSWIADGLKNLPGAVMLVTPTVGATYFQEFAPSVALDFAIVQSLDEAVTVPYGSFVEVLETSEGNLIDGPQLTDDKLFAPGVGLVQIDVLDERGRDAFTIELVDRTPPIVTLDDWTDVTFGSGSASSEHEFFPLDPGTFMVYEGAVEDGVIERLERYVSFETKTILGVETRVVRDKAYKDGVLVEVALDWFAQDTDGAVWYFGEAVDNYRYDAAGSLVSIDHLGSWIADGIDTFPGVVMPSEPELEDGYFQEFAPGVAFDFAIVTDLRSSVVTPVGSFEGVLVTAEGNYVDGPMLAENKLYAPEGGAGVDSGAGRPPPSRV